MKKEKVSALTENVKDTSDEKVDVVFTKEGTIISENPLVVQVGGWVIEAIKVPEFKFKECTSYQVKKRRDILLQNILVRDVPLEVYLQNSAFIKNIRVSMVGRLFKSVQKFVMKYDEEEK